MSEQNPTPGEREKPGGPGGGSPDRPGPTKPGTGTGGDKPGTGGKNPDR